MDPGKNVTEGVEVRYELCLQNPPGDKMDFYTSTQRFEIRSKDFACIQKIILMNGKIIHQEIVGIIGGTSGMSSEGFLDLMDFMNAGGVIGLHRNLVR